VARRYGVVPIRGEGSCLDIASSNPLSPEMEQDLGFVAARRIRIAVASPAAVRAAQEQVYGHAAQGPAARRPSGSIPAVTASAPAAPSTPPEPRPRFAWKATTTKQAPLVAPSHGAAADRLDEIVIAGLEQRASDIHIEPKDVGLLVRYRVDGSLFDAERVPDELAALLVSRLKVMAGLDIADRMRPQDGRASLEFEGRQIDLRISTLPLGNRGEKVVVRVLDARASTVDLRQLGFTPGELHRVQKLLASRDGMVLVTGPTGSGKTTTLYSALRHVQDPETNIVTVEDPIEYRLDGINQVQVHEKAGLTFSAALRSILRQDPDVVLVGEIRDGETAGIAIKASMTGHLVLSTLHTNDAPSAVGRLADIGADLGALAGALKGVVAQRLVRRLCPECGVPVQLSDLPLDQQMLLAGKRTDQLRGATGCASCRGTGYRGRMVVAEVLVVGPELQRAVARGAPRSELEAIARRGGMHTLWEAALERVLAGDTSLHEVLDNIAAPATDAPDAAAPQSDIDALLAQLRGDPAGGADAAPASPRVVRHEAGPALRVLVVDEDLVARHALRAVLEGEGMRVLEAAGGEAALAYARRLAPDVVVTEIAMPGLDGIGLVQALAAEGGPPVVVFTSQTDDAMLAWTRELGALDALVRPTDTAALPARLREAQAMASAGRGTALAVA
jgi:type II secretory ATPase GspE/PulE/Tfp pilus assembly ATPase PilB-like protein/ActR/RegA family two-component response regulator